MKTNTAWFHWCEVPRIVKSTVRKYTGRCQRGGSQCLLGTELQFRRVKHPRNGWWWDCTATRTHSVPLDCMGSYGKVVCFQSVTFSMVAQMAKDLPLLQGTWLQSLRWEGPLEKGAANPLQCSCLENSMDRGHSPRGGQGSDMTEQLTLCHNLKKKAWFVWSCDTAILLLGIYLEKILIQIIHAPQYS